MNLWDKYLTKRKYVDFSRAWSTRQHRIQQVPDQRQAEKNHHHLRKMTKRRTADLREKERKRPLATALVSMISFYPSASGSLSIPIFPHISFFFFGFLVTCTRLYKSFGRSVGKSVPLCFFLAFLGFLKVGKDIFEYFISYKQYSRLYKALCWSVGPSVCLSAFLYF